MFFDTETLAWVTAGIMLALAMLVFGHTWLNHG